MLNKNEKIKESLKCRGFLYCVLIIILFLANVSPSLMESIVIASKFLQYINLVCEFLDVT